MRKGDVVRFKDHEGNPCGPYALVTRILGNNVTVHFFTVNEVDTVKKENLHVCKSAYIKIPEWKLVECVKRVHQTVSHTIISSWLKALKVQPEVVTLSCPESKKIWNRYIFVCESVRIVTRLNERCIEIKLGKLLI